MPCSVTKVVNDSIVLRYRLLPFCLSNSGSLAMLTAMRRVSFLDGPPRASFSGNDLDQSAE